MFQLLLRPVILLSLLCIVPVALIRAQPYDDRQLRAFLTPPENCAAPCFMGIRPRITSAEEAVALLKAHAWVAHLDDNRVRSGVNLVYPLTLYWRWSGEQPEYINREVEGKISIFDGEIVSIEIETQIQLGDIKLTLGDPDSEWLNIYGAGSSCSFVYSGWYQHEDLSVLAMDRCSLRGRYTNRVLLQWIEPDL